MLGTETSLPSIDPFQRLVDSHPRAMMLANADARILYVNRMFERITGFQRSEVLGQRPSVLSSGFHGADFYQGMWRGIADQGRWEGVIWNRRKNGETYPQWLMIHEVPGDEETLYAGMFMDIGDLTSFEERLASMAYYDALTELPNRSLFLELLELRVARRREQSGCFALLFIDIDYFKDVNDLHGHAVGDQLLQQAAQCIRSVLRDDDVVARLSGDEFAAMVELSPADEEGQLERLAERLIQAFRSPLLIEGREYFVSISVGGAVYPGDGESGDELLLRADKAMYLAKQSGRGRFQRYRDELVLALDEDHRLAQALVASLKTAPSEFSVVYQPQYDLVSGQVDGLEALIRWQHPEFGLVSPGRFVPIAESRGLIHEVTEHLVRCVMADLWSLRHPPRPGLRLAINVSARQIIDDRLDPLLLPLFEQIRRLGWVPEMEITETNLMNLSRVALDRLRQFRALGIRVAIDDFGTGYSSLAYLHSLPVHTIKIDRQFVARLEHRGGDGSEERIVGAILAMADALGLEVIAEGIETAHQRQSLVAMECLRGQGYLMSRPVPWNCQLLSLLDVGQ